MVSNTNDYHLLHGTLIEPEGPNWRELMLDLGAPLVEFWHLSVWVTADRLREDSPYDVSEVVMLQDYRREQLGETEPTEEDVELFAPIYSMRSRIFLFDHKPTPDEVPPISPILPGKPFIEIKHSSRRDVGGSMSFRFEGVPHAERQEQFSRYLKWWETLSESVRGAPLGGTHRGKAIRSRIPRETFLSEGLAAAEALARKGKEHLHIYLLAEEMRRDRQAISNAIRCYPKEWLAINKRFTDTKVWLNQYKKP